MKRNEVKWNEVERSEVESVSGKCNLKWYEKRQNIGDGGFGKSGAVFV